MSRNRKRAKHAERRETADVITQPVRPGGLKPFSPGPADTSIPDPAPRPRTKGALIASIVLVAVWFLSLVLLVTLTSNPVVVNFQQIEASDHVITGKVIDPKDGKVEVEKDWKAAGSGDLELDGTIHVKPLKEIQSVSPGRSCLMPLRRVRGRYEITPQPGTRPRSPIYPATPDAEAQLEKILEQVRSRKG